MALGLIKINQKLEAHKVRFDYAQRPYPKQLRSLSEPKGLP
jgi:hypothetical protein